LQGGLALKEKQMYPLYFIVPAFALYLIFFVIPGAIGIGYSFTDWNAYSYTMNFVWLENYAEIFSADKNYMRYIGNTFRFTVISNIVKIIPAFFLAVMLQKKLRGRGFFRSVLYFPSVLPYIVIGIMFRSVLHPSNGILNQFLNTAGLGAFTQQWLTDPEWVWTSVIGVDAWRGIGYVMTIFLAGLQSIPETYYESADIDGAGFWAKLRHITLPLLTPAITINLVFGIAHGIRVFDVIYVLTNGGPGRETEVAATVIYKEFADGRYGMSSALSSLMFIFMAVVGLFIVLRMAKRRVVT